MLKKNEPKKIVKKTINDDPLQKFESPNFDKFKDALTDLSESWLWQNEFIDLYRLSNFCIRKYGNLFDDYRVRCNGRVIWTGSLETAEKLREKC